MADLTDVPAAHPIAEDQPKRITSLQMDVVISDEGKSVGLLNLGTPEGSFQFELDHKAALALKKAMKRYLRLPVKQRSP